MVDDGSQEELMDWLSSVNVACGAHAGDEGTMRATVEQALRKRVAVGAHPGYPDRENFGRIELQLSPESITNLVYGQLVALEKITGQCGTRIHHVKPHGALYNQAAVNRQIARAIANGVRQWRRDVVLMGLAESAMLEEFRNAGFTTAAEAFADRRYEANGTLRSRKLPNALIEDPEEAARQAVSIAERSIVQSHDGAEVKLQAQTLCIHGDTPGAIRIAAAVVKALRGAGIEVQPLAAR